jgi:hypothetical protein
MQVELVRDGEYDLHWVALSRIVTVLCSDSQSHDTISRHQKVFLFFISICVIQDTSTLNMLACGQFLLFFLFGYTLVERVALDHQQSFVSSVSGHPQDHHLQF